MTEDNDFIENLRSLGKQSARQKRLLALYDSENRTDDDNEALKVFIEAERTVAIARKASADATKKLAKHGNIARRLRTRGLIKLGGLVSIAGIEEVDNDVLLGALLEIRSATPETTAAWKTKGAEKFAHHEQEKARKKGKAA